jgi:hypothetical protein
MAVAGLLSVQLPGVARTLDANRIASPPAALAFSRGSICASWPGFANNERFLRLDSKPRLAVTAEYRFSRLPTGEREIYQRKAEAVARDGK